MEGFEGSRETIRNYIKEVFNVGRGSFFTTDVYKPYGSDTVIPVNEGLITYMSKGVKTPECNEGYDEEFVEEMRKKWVDYDDDDGGDDGDGKKKVITQWMMMEEIVEEHWSILRKRAEDNGQDVMMMDEDVKVLWSVMVKTLNKYKVKTHEKELERWLVTMIRMCDGRALKTIQGNIFSRLGI